MIISAVIPSCGRNWREMMTLRHLAAQEKRPDEIVIVLDAEDELIQKEEFEAMKVVVCRTTQRGAAAKRNRGVSLASAANILFADDDIEPRSDCLRAMEAALNSDRAIGAVGCFIENQRFRQPGRYSRLVWDLVDRNSTSDYSGRFFGPAITTYPRHDPDGPPTKEVEWLNSTCTLYRREVLPDPPFDKQFTGYSFMEDVALSRCVKKSHQLVVARDAWIIHHTRPAPYKNNAAALAAMAIKSKYHILTDVEQWTSAKAAASCTVYEMLMLPAHAVHALRHTQGWASIGGTAAGLAAVWRKSR